MPDITLNKGQTLIQVLEQQHLPTDAASLKAFAKANNIKDVNTIKPGTYVVPEELYARAESFRRFTAGEQDMTAPLAESFTVVALKDVDSRQLKDMLAAIEKLDRKPSQQLLRALQKQLTSEARQLIFAQVFEHRKEDILKLFQSLDEGAIKTLSKHPAVLRAIKAQPKVD